MTAKKGVSGPTSISVAAPDSTRLMPLDTMVMDVPSVSENVQLSEWDLSPEGKAFIAAAAERDAAALAAHQAAHQHLVEAEAELPEPEFVEKS